LMIFKMGGAVFGFLAAMGLRANPDASAAVLLSALDSVAGISAQVLGASDIAGFGHLQAAALMASNAWANKTKRLQVSSDRGAGLCLCKAPDKRCHIRPRRAPRIAAMGSDRHRKARRPMPELLERCAGRFGAQDDTLLEMSEEKARGIAESFQIGGAEVSIAEKLTGSRLEAIQSLVIERVALSEFRR